jgi:hypothetical protein
MGWLEGWQSQNVRTSTTVWAPLWHTKVKNAVQPGQLASTKHAQCGRSVRGQPSRESRGSKSRQVRASPLKSSKLLGPHLRLSHRGTRLEIGLRSRPFMTFLIHVVERTCDVNWSESIPPTRQPLPRASDPLGGHCSRRSGGVPSGAGLTNRAEISPPPVMRTVLVTESYRQPCEQGINRWPVSQLTPMNYPGQPIEEQRRREPVVRPSIPPDMDHTTKPSSTRPSAPKGISCGHEPGLRLCSSTVCDMTSGYFQRPCFQCVINRSPDPSSFRPLAPRPAWASLVPLGSVARHWQMPVDRCPGYAEHLSDLGDVVFAALV